MRSKSEKFQNGNNLFQLMRLMAADKPDINIWPQINK